MLPSSPLLLTDDYYAHSFGGDAAISVFVSVLINSLSFLLAYRIVRCRV